MNTPDLPVHYVCTHDKAKDIIAAHDRFWVSNCGCREERKACARSRTDVCLMFNPGDFASGSGKREVGPSDVKEIIQEAETKHLVARPFRNKERTDTDGICFCCDDCCGYFLNPDERCDKGETIAETARDLCTDCGACVDACYFKARRMEEKKLCVDEALCYGCGLCRDVCPEDSIKMVERAGQAGG